MSKNIVQTQGAFSFLDEVEKTAPLPKPKKHTLRPPAQIEVVEKTASEIHQAESPEPQQEERTITIPVADSIISVEEKNLSGEQEQPEMDSNTERIEDNTTLPPLNEGPEKTEEKSAHKRNSRGRKSAKEHSIAASMIEIPDDEELFSKQYYSMGEVTAMFKENHSLIRYWESEFDILKPKKNGKGDRFFRPTDIKNLHLIYDLLRRRKFTIEGAREYLKNNKKAEEKFAAVQSLEKIKAFFLELKASL